jgi:hypothetical protein
MTDSRRQENEGMDKDTGSFVEIEPLQFPNCGFGAWIPTGIPGCIQTEYRCWNYQQATALHAWLGRALGDRAAPDGYVPFTVNEAMQFDNSPCFVCGYNGANYYQPSVHACAIRYHAHHELASRPTGVPE